MSTKGKTYNYNQVKSVVFTPESHKYGAQYEVKFSDGEVWNNLTDLRDDHGDVDVNFIAKRALLHVDTLLNDPR